MYVVCSNILVYVCLQAPKDVDISIIAQKWALGNSVYLDIFFLFLPSLCTIDNVPPAVNSPIIIASPPPYCRLGWTALLIDYCSIFKAIWSNKVNISPENMFFHISAAGIFYSELRVMLFRSKPAKNSFLLVSLKYISFRYWKP